MPVPNFNPQEFAQSITNQAMDVLPSDLTDSQKEYTANKVFQFCKLAGEALTQDPGINLNADQAAIIAQLIGEWTFHKSIDVIRAQLPQDTWDFVLQQVAFAVFEIAKQTQVNNIPPEKAVAVVEKEVKASYEKALFDLVQGGKIQQNDVTRVLSYSNIDNMHEESSSNDEYEPEELNRDEEQTLKIATIALLLRTMPADKAEKILLSLSKDQAEKIVEFMSIPDLDQKFDHNIAAEFLRGLKSQLVSNATKYKNINTSPAISKLRELYTDNEIRKAVSYERANVRQYINYFLEEDNKHNNVEFNQHISSIIIKHVKNRLTAQ